MAESKGRYWIGEVSRLTGKTGAILAALAANNSAYTSALGGG